MNYRHAYHAGNFADVMKHAVLALVIEHMKRKPTPFRVIDTHAGIGLYDLSSEEAQKTGEAVDGINRIIDEAFSREVAELLEGYFGVVKGLNRGGGVDTYPGSPLLARSLVRQGDVVVANELHAQDHSRLKTFFARDRQVKVMGLDGWVAITALLPPKERRGVILIDPPFEDPLEFDKMVAGLRAGIARFATGTYLLWYPIKDEVRPMRFKRSLVALEPGPILDVTLMIRSPRDVSVLNGCGLAIVNPPFELDQKLQVLMPELARVLAQGPGAGATIEWLLCET